MNYERFYIDLNTRPTHEITKLMGRVVDMVKEREGGSFSGGEFHSENEVMAHAKEALLELQKRDIAKKLWIQTAVWSKFGSGHVPPADLDSATTALFQQPRVVDFLSSVSLQVDMAVKATRCSNLNENRGEEEYKQTNPSRLLSNATSALRDPRRKEGPTNFPPPQIPNIPPPNHQTALTFFDKHYIGGDGGRERGAVPAPAVPDPHLEAQEHQMRIDHAAEEHRQRRAAQRQESLQSSAHSAQCTRQTLPMPAHNNGYGDGHGKSTGFGNGQFHNQSPPTGQNGFQSLGLGNGCPPPVCSWTPNGTSFSNGGRGGGGGRGRGRGRGGGDGRGSGGGRGAYVNGQSNGYHQDQHFGFNGNGKRNYESYGPPIGGAAAGGGPPRQRTGRF